MNIVKKYHELLFIGNLGIERNFFLIFNLKVSSYHLIKFLKIILLT